MKQHLWMIVALGLTVSAVWAAPGPGAARDREFQDAAGLEPDLAHGRQLFVTCAACHGEDGRGTEDGEIPAISGQHGSVLLKQLTDFRHAQRVNERMQYFTDQHHLTSAQDVTDVAAFVSRLPRLPISTKGVGDGAMLSAGASVYFQDCEHCHGPLGQGDLLRRRPRLAGQHYAYLLRQLEETAGGQRPGMDRRHVDLLNGLSHDQLRGVADYLSRLSPELASSRRP